MKIRWLFLLLGGLLLACGTSSAVATPDLVATEVAVKKAAAATLTAEATPAAPTPTQNEPATLTPTPLPTQTDSSPATGDTVDVSSTTAPVTNTPPAPTCMVVANGLNLRPGPGVVYEPALASLAQGETFTPQARLDDNSWLEVRVEQSGQIGWVSAGPEYISCNIDLSSLPLGQIPPTPTPLPTPTPIPPTPTQVVAVPTPPLLVDVPVDGGQSDLHGQILIPGFTRDQLKGPEFGGVVFRDRLVFAVDVFNNKNVKEVKIQINGPNGDVHERTERTPAYCVFGGGEPDCNVLVFAQTGYHWPEKGKLPIKNGLHQVNIEITTKDDHTENWVWSFWIQHP